jgi:hypothetical protein
MSTRVKGVRNIAAALGVCPEKARAMLKANRIKAVLLDGVWVTTSDDIAAFWDSLGPIPSTHVAPRITEPQA